MVDVVAGPRTPISQQISDRPGLKVGISVILWAAGLFGSLAWHTIDCLYFWQGGEGSVRKTPGSARRKDNAYKAKLSWDNSGRLTG